MAVTRFSAGQGTTANPLDAAIRSGQVPAASANSTWMLKGITEYNRPPQIVNTPDSYERAATQQARIIEEARKRAEEMRRQQLQRAIQMGQVPGQATQPQMDEGRRADMMRYQAQQAAIGGYIEAGMSPEDARKMYEMEQERNAPSLWDRFTGFLTSPAPNFNITTDPMGNPIQGGSPVTEAPAMRGPDRPGYRQSPVMDGSGNIIGYEYVKLMSATVPTKEDVAAAAQPGANQVTSQQTGYISIYDEISALENSFSARKAKVAEEVWGKPVEVENPDGSTSLQWGTNGMEYLGMSPGQVVAPVPRKPAEDAPYEDWVKYRDRLRKGVRKPLYTPDSLDNVFSEMGVSGIKQFQRAALAARLYDTNDAVSLGNLSQKDYEIMNQLMELGNLNGTTWEDQMVLLAEHAAKQKEQSGGGGGGGGGGAGGTSVYTQITYNQTSMAQARTILTSVLQEALGRRPTDQELNDFIAMLNEAESKDPTKTVTRTTVNGKRTRAVARTTPGVVDPEQMAEEFAAEIGGGAPMTAKRETDYLMGYLNSLGGLA